MAIVALALIAAALLVGPASMALSLMRTIRARPEARGGTASQEQPRLLFLVPAHDERAMIAACVQSVRAMDYPPNKLDVVVVADNCTDDTAERARNAGARCLERHEPALPGKPHAIAWALDRLPLEEYECCVIFDADSTASRHMARALAEQAPLQDKIIQGYFSCANEQESWLTCLAGVLTRIRYEVEYPLKARVGLNCPLTGNGMCFGTAILRRHGWTAFSLTENWQLYAQFTIAGYAIRYVPGALLHSDEARSLAQASTQRRRWLAGRSLVAFQYTARVIGSARIGWHQKVDALAELWALSPALHAGVAFAMSALSAALLSGVARTLAVAAFATSLLPMIGTTALVMSRHPNRKAVARALVHLPAYVLWRMLIAARTMLSIRDQRWRRTERLAPSSSPTGLTRR